MRNILVVAAMFSFGSFALAQQASVATSQLSQGCPIGFGAQIDSRLIARTIDDERKGAIGPFLTLKFQPRGTASISAATVTVHGLTSYSRYLPVSESTNGHATQSFHLTSDQRAAGLRDADVHVDKVISVDWVDLKSVQYADGSQWLSAPDEQCRAAVSKLLLIDAVVGQRVQR